MGKRELASACQHHIIVKTGIVVCYLRGYSERTGTFVGYDGQN